MFEIYILKSLWYILTPPRIHRRSIGWFRGILSFLFSWTLLDPKLETGHIIFYLKVEKQGVSSLLHFDTTKQGEDSNMMFHVQQTWSVFSPSSLGVPTAKNTLFLIFLYGQLHSIFLLISAISDQNFLLMSSTNFYWFNLHS